MKLKINPKFQQCPTTDGDEIYQNGFFHFNITKMLEYIMQNQSNFPIEEVLVKDIHNSFKDNFDEATIAKANLENPIILAEIAPNYFNVIDGNHRLERAYRSDITKIRAYRITPKDHTKFLISLESYQAYVRYWNSKLD